jgi:hypothetical protein
MSGKYGLFRNSKSIAGIALIGLGLFILCGNLADTVARFSRLAGGCANAKQAFGGLVVAGLAVSQVWRAYVFNRRELVLCVWRLFASFWPLLVVMVGAVLMGTVSESV